MSINDEFQPGFKGLLGDGAGQHTASKMERLDHVLINLLENSVWQLWTLMRGQGHYGPFKLETATEYTTETFDGDGVTTEFQISKAIPREVISGYDIRKDYPYQHGIEPSGSVGTLSSFSSSTNLSNTVTFETAPPVGKANVIIIYYDVTEWGSSLNSSAYLSDSTVS